MVFSSSSFLLCFLPIALLGYYLLGRVANYSIQKRFLLVASLFFYAFNNPKYLLLILISVVVNFSLSAMLQKMHEKTNINKYIRGAVLVVGVLFNVLLFGYYKYLNFFIENINVLFGMEFAVKQIVLPLGISFFTFQQLSFLISVYHGENKVDDFFSYFLFVTFFPQLVAGPIVLYDELVPQFRDERKGSFDLDQFCSAVFIFVIGLFKKAVIADTFAIFVKNGFGVENLGCIPAWCVAFSYSFQIYFDFSGYSDMAVGLARMFNFHIPFNFLSPYQSKSIREFWKRWHITLGRALSYYIYIPMGGNRKGLSRTCINLMLTFLVSGFWHGAAWTYIIWGALHGIFSVIERMFEKTLKKIPEYIRAIGTFLMVNFLWVLFRAESIDQAIEQYKNMFDVRYLGIENFSILANNGVINYPNLVDCGYVIGLIFICMVIVFFSKNSRDQLESFQLTKSRAVLVAVMFCMVIACLSRQSIFIYFNF